VTILPRADESPAKPLPVTRGQLYGWRANGSGEAADEGAGKKTAPWRGSTSRDRSSGAASASTHGGAVVSEGPLKGAVAGGKSGVDGTRELEVGASPGLYILHALRRVPRLPSSITRVRPLLPTPLMCKPTRSRGWDLNGRASLRFGWWRAEELKQRGRTAGCAACWVLSNSALEPARTTERPRVASYHPTQFCAGGNVSRTAETKRQANTRPSFATGRVQSVRFRFRPALVARRNLCSVRDQAGGQTMGAYLPEPRRAGRRLR